MAQEGFRRKRGCGTCWMPWSFSNDKNC